ncbi:MAG: Neutral ceramidase precursor [Paenibacillus sp.]|jgi:hypothetical protein|nr:Neutral ceramidase precursor [Paenibacillus sp.]
MRAVGNGTREQKVKRKGVFNNMKFWCASRDMTPDQPIFMHGFGARTGKSTGVHDPLYIKAAMLSANKTLLVITIDSLGSDRAFVLGIKETLRERFGLAPEDVLINFSHTHHSVFLTGPDANWRRGGYSIDQDRWTDDDNELDFSPDVRFYEFVRDLIADMTNECYQRLEEGELRLAQHTSDFAVSRRRPEGQGVVWKPYFEGEIDKELLVLTIVDRSGALRAVLYNYGCHTTSMGPDNLLLSNDFAGQTSKRLEANYPGAMALFLQGCAGELKPRAGVLNDKFYSMSLQEMEQAGDALADEVTAIINNRPFVRIECEFASRMADPQLRTELTEPAVYEAMAADPAYNSFYRSAAARTLRAIEDDTVKTSIPHYIVVWQLDKRTHVVAMEGEVSTEYALKIKRLFGSQTLVLGYTNGVFCYIPTRKMISEGGYEAICNFFFTMRGPFLPEIEDVIMSEIGTLRNGLVGARE